MRCQVVALSLLLEYAHSFAQQHTSSSHSHQELKETSIRELVATGKIEMHEASVVSASRASFFCLSLFGSNSLPSSFCTCFYFCYDY